MATHTDEWGDLEGQFVTSLREKRVEPVPAQIVKLAQKSYDGVEVTQPDGSTIVRHAMEKEFETPERAARFAAHMRNAGPHTNPPSSVTVLVDPEQSRVPVLNEDGSQKYADNGKPVTQPGDPVNPSLVRWRAGKPRGRQPGSNGS